MSRLSKIISIAALLALVSHAFAEPPSPSPTLASAPPPATAAGEDAPNIILIIVDDIGYHALTAYGGSSFVTPRIDDLAATGVRFEHCYSQPLCSTSRVKIMSGEYNYRNYIGWGIFDPNETTFAHVLGDAGYATCMAGKWQLYLNSFGHVTPEEAGFDEHCVWGYLERGNVYWDPVIRENGLLLATDEADYGPDIFNAYSIDFMTRNQGQPFFLYYPMVLAHRPLVATPDSPPESDTDQELFTDMVAYMDKMIGQLLDEVDELGLAENTLILFVGDNGCETNIEMEYGDVTYTGHKRYTDDLGNHVPLIARWSGQSSIGAMSDDLICFTDFLPTMAEAANAPLPDEHFDGQSFLPQILGETGNPREWLYSWHSPMTPWSDYPLKRFVRTQQWKLYPNGNLFDVPNDIHEDFPVPLGASPEADAARAFLQDAMEEAESGLPFGDLDADRDVDADDLLRLLAAWGTCDEWCREDLDEDGIVAVSDLLILLAAWG